MGKAPTWDNMLGPVEDGDLMEHKPTVHRITKNAYGVDCPCDKWSVYITTKNAFGTTESHAIAWARAHRDGKERPDGYQDPRSAT